jgi:hypothetical protein
MIKKIIITILLIGLIGFCYIKAPTETTTLLKDAFKTLWDLIKTLFKHTPTLYKDAQSIINKIGGKK